MVLPLLPLVTLLLATFLSLRPTVASADTCYVVYDESYRAVLKQASGIDYPSRNGNFSSMAECRQALSAILSNPQYRHDSGLNRSRCECVGGGSSGGGGYRVPSGGSLEQQVAGIVVQGFLNLLLSGINAPSGPDGDAVRKKLKKQWAEEEALRKLAEKKRMEEQFQSAQTNATTLLGNRPAGKGKGELLNFSVDESLDLPPVSPPSPGGRP